MRRENSESKNKYFKKKLNLKDRWLFSTSGGLNVENAEHMRENVISIIQVPIGIAGGFIINGKELEIPLATEERGIITMAVEGAMLAAKLGGFKAEATQPIMKGQIQLLDIIDHNKAKIEILSEKENLLKIANTASKHRKAIDLEVKVIRTVIGRMLIVELFVDVRDSMGSNIVDTMCELIAPIVADQTCGRVNMSVVSNLSSCRMIRVEAKVEKDLLGGERIIDRIIEAHHFAEADPYRATTHNKGIMNGIISVLMATSNDTRAVEAGAHAYASITGKYKPLTKWVKTQDGNLYGLLEMPLAVGIIGGAVSHHPLARQIIKLLQIKSSNELAEIAGSVGLACNLSALHNLVTSGIKQIQL
jgi:hydroxymethylglutaryl-CoA reductase